MKEFFKSLKTFKICDLISLACVAAYSVIVVASIIYFSVLGAIIPFVVTTSIMLIFAACGVFTYSNRLPIIWLLMGVGMTIAACCNNSFNRFENVFFIVSAIIFYGCGIAATVFQIIEKLKPRGFKYVSFSAFALITAFSGIVWGANVGAVSGKDVSAQTEIWAVPDKYDVTECPQQGKVEKLTYTTKAYATDKREVTKTMYAYLPYNYDENEQYNILYLMHGTGDYEDYWLIKNANNKTMIDNLIYHGDIEPLIIITPTWYVENDCEEDLNILTGTFKEELCNEIIPLVETKYSTYAAGDTSAESLTATRDHRAFAGLSRGAITTLRTAFCGCLNYFSYFGAFSGFNLSEDEIKAAIQSEEFKDLPINYFYNSSGTFDITLKLQIKGLKRLLEYEDRLEMNKNFCFDIFPMEYHSAASWHLALYNFLQKIF